MSAFWTQYCPGLTALLLWLTSAPATRPPRKFASGAAVLDKCESALAVSSRVRSAAQTPVQQRLRAAPECAPGPPQHLYSRAYLYEKLTTDGKAPHAAYLTAFCSAAGGSLLIRAMEQGMPVNGAHLARPKAGAAPARRLLFCFCKGEALSARTLRRTQACQVTCNAACGGEHVS